MTTSTTNGAYPLCSQLGVLRETPLPHRHLTVSTARLYELFGWRVYKTYLPFMEHRTNAGEEHHTGAPR